MTASRLLLEHYFVEELSVTANVDADPAIFADWQPEPTTERDYASSPDDLRLHQVRLTVTVGHDDPGAAPYRVRLALRGIFRLDPSVEDKRLRDGLLTNTAPSILYGAAREVVLATTARGPFPPVLLPAEVFQPQVLDDDSEPAPPPSEPSAPARPRRKRAKTSD